MSFSKGKMGATLGALAFLTVTNAWAKPPTPAPTPKTFQPCDCKAYLPASQGLRLSQDLAAIGMQEIAPGGNTIERSRELHQAHRDRILSDTQIPSECREYVASELGYGPWSRSFELQSTVLGRKDSVFASNPGERIGHDLLLALQVGRAKWSTIPCTYPTSPLTPSPALTAYRNCLIANQAASKASVKANLQSGSEEARAIELNAFFGKPWITESDIRVLRAFETLSDSKDFETLLRKMQTQRKKLTDEEVIHVVALFGAQMNQGYDMKRVDNNNPASKGIVSEDTLLKAVNFNLHTEGFYTNDPAGVRMKAGVCRDMAHFQAKLLDAAGLKAYIVGYGSLPGSHATVIAQGKDAKRTLYKINYGHVQQRTEADGARALYQGSSLGIKDYTSTYTIYAPNGSHVQNIPSEMGKFLAEASGFDIRDYDPLSRKEGRMDSFKQSIPLAKAIDSSFQVFSGRDGNDSDYTGVAHTNSWQKKGSFPGKVGTAMALRRDLGIQTGDPEEDRDLIVVYGQFKQGYRTSDIPLTESTRFQLETTLQGYGELHSQLQKDGSSKKGNLGKSGTLNAQSEARFKTQHSQKTKSETAVTVSVGQGLQDNRGYDASDLSTYKLTLSNLSFRQKVEHTLSPETQAYVQALLVGSALGLRGSLEVGLVHKKLAASLNYSGALGFLIDEPSLIEESALQRLRAATRYQLSDGVDLGLDLQLTGIDTVPETPLEVTGTAFVGGTL